MFSKELGKLALEYAAEPIVKIGDIVTTQWADWKHPHKVEICEIGVHLVSTNCRARKENESVRQWLNRVSLIGVDLYYYAFRLNKKYKIRSHSAIVLNKFITESGKKWQKKHDDFNHCGLSWIIARSPKIKY